MLGPSGIFPRVLDMFGSPLNVNKDGSDKLRAWRREVSEFFWRQCRSLDIVLSLLKCCKTTSFVFLKVNGSKNRDEGLFKES